MVWEFKEDVRMFVKDGRKVDEEEENEEEGLEENVEMNEK